MGGKKTIGIILLAAGAILLILSMIADVIGIGGSPIFGWRQILGIIIGLIAAVVGLVLTIRK